MNYYIEVDENNIIKTATEATSPPDSDLFEYTFYEVSEFQVTSLGWEYNPGTGAITKPTSLLETEIREKRNELLATTDKYALQDLTMTAEMQTYRQALRDITDQAGFPNSVTWPTKPGE